MTTGDRAEFAAIVLGQVSERPVVTGVRYNVKPTIAEPSFPAEEQPNPRARLMTVAQGAPFARDHSQQVQISDLRSMPHRLAQIVIALSL